MTIDINVLTYSYGAVYEADEKEQSMSVSLTGACCDCI